MNEIDELIDELSAMSDEEIILILGKIIEGRTFVFAPKDSAQPEIVPNVDIGIDDIEILTDRFSPLSNEDVKDIYIGVSVGRTGLPRLITATKPPPMKDPVYVLPHGKCFHAKVCEANQPRVKGQSQIPMERADAEKRGFHICPICVLDGRLKS